VPQRCAVCTGRSEGVKEARVSLERQEAVVKYDPDVTTLEDLIKAVKNARGMHPYEAKVVKET
jgi:copper chaperone CopZ